MPSASRKPPAVRADPMNRSADALHAGETVAAIRAFGPDLDILEIVARLPLGEGEGELAPAFGDRGQNLGLLLIRTCKRHGAAAHDHGGQIRLGDQAAAYGLHDDHRFDAGHAEAAMLLREGDGEPAELGELPPVLVGPALLGGHQLAARLEAVVLAHEALHALLQKLLVLGIVEVHGLSLFLPVCGRRPEAAKDRARPWR